MNIKLNFFKLLDFDAIVTKRNSLPYENVRYRLRHFSQVNISHVLNICFNFRVAGIKLL